MKNSNNRRIKSSILILMVTIVALTFSCNSIYDNVEKYMDGEIVYIDKLDGILKVQIGYERVEIDLLEAGRIPASRIRMAKATKTVIECPDFTEPDHRRVIDSICSWVNVTGLDQLKNYELSIYTEDDYGNRSLPMKTSVRPYTRENLNSLEITPPSINASSSSAQIEWLEGVSATTHQVYSYAWQFTDRNGAVVKYEDVGDKVVIFLENIMPEIDIPVTLTCRLVPTLSNFNGAYVPIIDTVDYQKTLSFRLSSDAEDVIFLKSPISSSETDLTDDLTTTFSWTKTDIANGYSLKFSLVPNFPDEATYSVDVGDVNEYEINDANMLDIFNSLSTTGYIKDFYWTVIPTTQDVSVKTQFRSLKVLKVGKYYEYDRTGWEVVSASSTLENYILKNAFDNNLGTFWHSSEVILPHWFIVDMKDSKSIFKFDVHRPLSFFSDTKRVELYLGNSPNALDIWTKIGEGTFDPNTTANQESYIEVLTMDNITKGRYLKLQFLNGRAGSNPYVNVSELYLFYK